MKQSPKLSESERKFLSDMIEHHKMALVMSKDALKNTSDHDIMSLAYSILQTQSNEIALMKEILRLR